MARVKIREKWTPDNADRVYLVETTWPGGALEAMRHPALPLRGDRHPSNEHLCCNGNGRATLIGRGLYEVVISYEVCHPEPDATEDIKCRIIKPAEIWPPPLAAHPNREAHYWV